MRENTRCEVEEPISTPTLSTTISSSSTKERPVEEKKVRPPSASSVIARVPGECSGRPCASGTRPGTQRTSREAQYWEHPSWCAGSRLSLARWQRANFAVSRARSAGTRAPERTIAHELRAHEFRHHRALLVEV